MNEPEQPKDIFLRASSPLEIEIALHYYCRSKVWNDPTPLFFDIVKMYLSEGIFEEINKEPFYQVTQKGAFWIKELCSLPFPEIKYVIPVKNDMVTTFYTWKSKS